ncbi:hypothetical protein EXIGLDRAFT_470606 [Exidia glandulosa HHB12029]|uniref:Uncharacterized protein n=1 Tax=Exidia glandulosa HHB12029 TaxID=1314781 RepID=A0A165JZH4_EXIGL|nr:hypothetical protein EXIGLDRAFT_470606 [Exidia glandulosa HHB12029]
MSNTVNHNEVLLSRESPYPDARPTAIPPTSAEANAGRTPVATPAAAHASDACVTTSAAHSRRAPSNAHPDVRSAVRQDTNCKLPPTAARCDTSVLFVSLRNGRSAASTVHHLRPTGTARACDPATTLNTALSI